MRLVKQDKRLDRSSFDCGEPELDRFVKTRAKKACRAAITPEQSFFGVFCIERLAVHLNTSGDAVYRKLTEASDLLDTYIFPCYDALHTQGEAYIVRELTELMKARGVLP
jgi:hypothetical protein